MRKIEEIREAFSKGHILVGKRGVFVIYNNPPAGEYWVSQSIDGNHKSVFEDLLRDSDRFRISTKIGESVSVGFLSDKAIDGEFEDMVFPRLEEELSQAEIKKRLSESPKDPRRQQDMQDLFLKHFDGVDIKDEGAVLSNAANWLMAVMKYNKPDAAPIKVFHSWKELKRYAQAFYQAYPKIGEVEFGDPTTISPSGFVEFTIPSKKDEEFILPAKAKELFYKMLLVSESYYMECYIAEDEVYVTIDFYV